MLVTGAGFFDCELRYIYFATNPYGIDYGEKPCSQLSEQGFLMESTKQKIPVRIVRAGLKLLCPLLALQRAFLLCLLFIRVPLLHDSSCFQLSY